MRSKFDEQLALLHWEIITMGALCEKAIAMSVRALTEGNRNLAAEVPALSAEIDGKEREIEGMCFKLLLQQQPVAKDLRVVSSALKMVTDLERIGDNSGDIAEIVQMGHVSSAHNTESVEEMARATVKMVTDSIDAFVKQDDGLAKSVVEYDDIVDGHFNRIKAAITKQLESGSADGEAMLDLLMIAKYFERMGDHAVQIARWVLFSVTGEKSVQPPTD